MLAAMRRDVHAALDRDPAARSRLEVVLCYPGVWAIWGYRIAHALWRARLKLAARFVSPARPGSSPASTSTRRHASGRACSSTTPPAS